MVLINEKILFLQWSSSTSFNWMKVDELFGNEECKDDTMKFITKIPANRH